MTEQEFWRLRAVQGLDEWTDAELEAEGTTREEMMAYSQRMAEHLVRMRDRVWRYRWKKTGDWAYDALTMVLTPRPSARLCGPAKGRPREHRSAGGNPRRGPPGDDDGPEPPCLDAPKSHFGQTWAHALHITGPAELDSPADHATYRAESLRAPKGWSR